MSRNERAGAVRHIRDSAAARDVVALVTELRDHLGDAVLAARALKSLGELGVSDGTLAEVTRGAGGIDTAVAALRTHGVNADVALFALRLLAVILIRAEDSAFEASAADIATETVAALRRHSDNAAVLIAGCMTLAELCAESRIGLKFWSAADVCGAAQDAIRFLSAALRAHIGTVDIEVQAVIALGELFCVVAAGTADIGVQLGCVELIIAAMRTHRGRTEKYERLQTAGCRALAMICWGAGASRQLDACRSIEAVFESMRRYPDCASVHAAGCHALFMYRFAGGRRIDADYDGLGTEALQAALAALRRHSKDADVLCCVFNLLTYDLGPNENEPHPNNWMLPLLGTPENLALLQRSAKQFDGRPGGGAARFVAHMTHGACAGCDKLQETKMRLCNRCRHARYCSVECQRKH
jgi:hypothetical protein